MRLKAGVQNRVPTREIPESPPNYREIVKDPLNYPRTPPLDPKRRAHYKNRAKQSCEAIRGRAPGAERNRSRGPTDLTSTKPGAMFSPCEPPSIDRAKLGTALPIRR